jgi:hypothetical protein
MEWAMKVQEIILRAIAKKITWIQAAQIIGISPRQSLAGLQSEIERLKWALDEIVGEPVGEC